MSVPRSARGRTATLLIAVTLVGCTSSTTTSSQPIVVQTATYSAYDLKQAQLQGFEKGYKVGYAKAYRLGKEYICNTLYGSGTPSLDGWRYDSADPVNGPVHKAIVLIWYAAYSAEVPQAVTKADCLTMAK